jgi:Flp pilus assembly protein TadG
MLRNTRQLSKKKNCNPEGGKRRRQRGAALVETALVLTTLLGMIVFIVDMGRILLIQQFIGERARVGVRSAVVNNWDASQVANYVVYGSPGSAQNSVGNDQSNTQQPGFLGLLPSQVTFTSYPDSGIGDARYQVTVQGVPLFTWIPFMAGQYNSPTVTATMPVQSLGATN